MSFSSLIRTAGSSFAGSLNEQTYSGENTIRSLEGGNPDDPDRVPNFGALGDFAKRIDGSANRSYVESGYVRNVKPRKFEVLLQEPNLTIVIKKRLFSSLVDNYRLDLMDAGEKLFFRASKKLFQNKCIAISTYEKLSKIERVVQNKGVVDEFMLPEILSGIDALDQLGVDVLDPKARATMETLRKLNILADPSQFTSWIVDKDSPFASDTGEGTGTFEITNVSNISTKSTTVFGGGSASITIEDPYKLMIVTNEDIDKAITDATNLFKQNSFFRVSEFELDKITEGFKKELNALRLRRGSSLIQFRTNPDTLLYKRVRATTDGILTVLNEENGESIETGSEFIFNYDAGFLGIGGSVDLDPSAIANSKNPNGLSRTSQTIQISPEIQTSSKTEVELFKDIIRNTFQLISLRKTTETEVVNFNNDSAEGRNVQYVREKMRLHYANKTIIQPMDVINIFISSKTIIDNKIDGVLERSFTGGSILQGIDNVISKLQTSFNDLDTFFGGGQNDSAVEIEKQAIVGPDFPTWLWILLRNDFTRQAAGVCQFVGPVTGASSKYNDGKYVVSIQASDNTYYFGISQVNIKPSVDVFNSTLYDPLTPYDLDFDASSGFLKGEQPNLLIENQKILNSPNTKLKNGRHRGAQSSSFLYKNDDGEFSVANPPLNFRSLKNDPDGFVYRWKSGIGSLTAIGEPHPISSLKEERAPALTKNPFAGQDVMNVISLLITGQPYNFNNFMKAAIESGNINNDDLLNEDMSRSFFRGLLSDLTKQNSIWGNFIPFKKLVVSEQGYRFMRSGQADITQQNGRINDLIERRARFFDALVQTVDGKPFANNPRIFSVDSSGQLDATSLTIKSGTDLKSRAAQDAAIEIAKLDLEIDAQQKELQNKISSANTGDAGNIRIYGDDISYDQSVSEGGSDVTEDQLQRERIDFRRKLNILTQRRLWKVKANEDPNLFIVDDQYDKNFDIQAFEKGLIDKFQLFNSDYSSISERIQQVSSILGLEIYADTQGHIQAKPPGYNKVPSSIFERMLRDRDRKGIRVFPKVLESLFINQAEGLIDQLEITEDNIRLRAAALNKPNDEEAKKLLNGSKLIGSANTDFAFLTSSNGKFGTKDIRSLVNQAKPEDIENRKIQSLTKINSDIAGQLSTGVLFDVTSRINVLNAKSSFQDISNSSADARIKEINNRLEFKKGVTNPNVLGAFTTDRKNKTLQSDVLKIVSDLSRLVSERQSLIKRLAVTLKNVTEGVFIENDPNLPKKVSLPNLTKKGTIPAIIEHMIEDENTDDLGAGSGARYIIKENQIISLDIKEEPPESTIQEVNGLFGDGFVDPPSSLSLGSGGGNAVVTAFAADYDMWRMYGFRKPQTKMAPFLSNPDTQCAPFAVYLLNLARKNILQGTVTMVGNEFMQPGEVVYIEDRDLLFYVESVDQSFSFGGYQTILTLKYGHNPGEYIPTMLDIVGKGLYSKRHQANLIRHNRHGHANGEVPMNTIVIDTNTLRSLDSGDSSIKALLKGKFAKQNRSSLSNIILALTGALTPGTNNTPQIQLRTYANSEASIKQSTQLAAITGAIKEWIKNPSVRSSQDEDSLLPEAQFPDGFRIDDDTIVHKEIDAKENTESPSSGAWSAARLLAESEGSELPEALADGATILAEDIRLFSNIIDIWMVKQPVPETIATSRGPNNITSQSALEDAAFLIKNNTTVGGSS